VGLAGGILFTYILYSLVLLYFLRVHVGCSFASFKEFYKILMKIIIASAISGLIGYLVFSTMANIFSLDKVKHLILDAGLSFVFTLISFLILSNLFQIKEIKELKSFLSKKFYVKRSQ
jgi:hypothetical protein